ncbi:MAG: phosphate acyltransferase PlsX [Acidobacteriota bacterium]
MKKFRIAVDAMGGDHAPAIPVKGALEAARELGVKVLLVGREEDLRAELARHSTRDLDCELVPAADVIGMEEKPLSAIRQKRQSSIAVAVRLVRETGADGMISAGNTGAVMATSKIFLGTLTGVDRPALMAVIPNLRGPGTLLDVGANLDIKPVHYLHFAAMGYLYSHLILGIPDPRVGLMSTGEEETKGTETLREAYSLLRNSGLNFIGNIEGKDVFSGVADVIVCDGFTGNVSLKVMESTAEMISHFLKQEARESFLTRLGFFLARSTFRKFRQRIDYSEYGGAPLLGVKGAIVVCHGRSSPKAIQNGIRVAMEFVKNRVAERIQEEIHRLSPIPNRSVGDLTPPEIGQTVPVEGGKG